MMHKAVYIAAVAALITFTAQAYDDAHDAFAEYKEQAGEYGDEEMEAYPRMNRNQYAAQDDDVFYDNNPDPSNPVCRLPGDYIFQICYGTLQCSASKGDGVKATIDSSGFITWSMKDGEVRGTYDYTNMVFSSVLDPEPMMTDDEIYFVNGRFKSGCVEMSGEINCNCRSRRNSFVAVRLPPKREGRSGGRRSGSDE